MKHVVLYGRPGCHLCADARLAVDRVRRRVEFTLEERNIEEDDALHKAYLERIPVVTVDGVEAYHYFVDEVGLEELLRDGMCDGAHTPSGATGTGLAEG